MLPGENAGRRGVVAQLQRTGKVGQPDDESSWGKRRYRAMAPISSLPALGWQPRLYPVARGHGM